jgi:hypothetical protein
MIEIACQGEVFTLLSLTKKKGERYSISFQGENNRYDDKAVAPPMGGPG